MSHVTNSDTRHTEIGKDSGPDSKAICAVSKKLCSCMVLRAYPDFSGAAPSCHEPASKLLLPLSQRRSPFRPTLPPLMRQILAYAGKDNPCCPLLGRRNTLLPGEVKGRIKEESWTKESLISHLQLSLWA